MVSIITEHRTNEQKLYIEAACLSTDDKPVGANIATGSICTEINTGKVFFYNAAAASGSEWVEQFSFQG